MTLPTSSAITSITFTPSKPNPGDVVLADLVHVGYYALLTPPGWSIEMAVAGHTKLTALMQADGLPRLSLVLCPTSEVSIPVPPVPPPPAPPAVQKPLWLAPYEETGETTGQCWRRHVGYTKPGVNVGPFIMLGPDKGIHFDQPFIDLANTHGDKPIPILFSPKGGTAADMRAFMEVMQDHAAAWLEHFVLCPWQEPWDNKTTAAATADYRLWASYLFDVVHEFGGKTALEIQDAAFWYTGGRSDRRPIEEFIVPTKTDMLLASVYNYSNLGNSELDTRIPKIAAKAKSLGLPWGVAASGMPVTTMWPSHSPQVSGARSASWSTKLITLLETYPELVGFGHYAYMQGNGSVFIDGDTRLRTIPELMNWWMQVVVPAFKVS